MIPSTDAIVSATTGCVDRGLQAARIDLRRRYLLQISIGVWISISNGAIFCFGIFSPYLKQAPFNFTQSQVNAIATAGAMASFVTPPVGYLFDHYGPSITLAAGAALNLVGWAGLFYIFNLASGTSPSSLFGSESNNHSGSSSMLGLFVIAVVFSLSQMSSPFYEQGSVLANLQAVSTHRGKVVLVQKTFMGLGSGIISQIYSTFFVPSTSNGDHPANDAASRSLALQWLGWFCMVIAVYSVLTGVLGALVTVIPKGTRLRVSGINNAPVDSSGGVSEIAPALPPTVVSATDLNGDSTHGSSVAQMNISAAQVPENGMGRSAVDVGYQNAVQFEQQRQHFHHLAHEEMIAARRYRAYFSPATVLTLVIVALVATITIVDAYWSKDVLNGEGSETSFDNWQLGSSVVTMVLCLLFVPMVYLVPSALSDSPLVPGDDAHRGSSLPPQLAVSASSSGPRREGAGSGEDVSPTPMPNVGTSSGGAPSKTNVGLEIDSHSLMQRNLKQPEEKVRLLSSLALDREDLRSGPKPSFSPAQIDSATPPTTVALRSFRRARFSLNSRALKHNLLATPNWWLLWLQCFSVWGAATLVSTNSSQIFFALDPNGYSDTANAAMVSIFGVASALGRVAVGALEETIRTWTSEDEEVVNTNNQSPRTSLQQAVFTPTAAPSSMPYISNDNNSSSGARNSVTRFCSQAVSKFRLQQPDELVPVYFLLVPSFVLSIGLPLFLVAPPNMLLFCFFLVGFAAGFTYGSVILVVSCLLGPEHAGKHYGFVGSAGFATPILFNMVIFAQTYDDVGEKQSSYATNGRQCIGAQCLYTSIIISTVLSVVAFLLMVVLVRRVLRDGHI